MGFGIRVANRLHGAFYVIIKQGSTTQHYPAAPLEHTASTQSVRLTPSVDASLGRHVMTF